MHRRFSSISQATPPWRVLINLLGKTGLLLWLVWGLMASPVSAARLADTIISNTRDDLLVFTHLEQAFPPEMTEAAQSGVPITFSFYIKVFQIRGFWPDKTIASKKVTHTLKYDNLKEKYTVKRSWMNDSVLTTESFAEAQKHMQRVEGLTICRMEKLEKGRKYKVKAKAELEQLSLPHYLRYILFFMSFGEIETDWQTIVFTY